MRVKWKPDQTWLTPARLEKHEPNTCNMSPARLPKNHPLSVHLKFKLELVDVKCLWQLKLNHRNAFDIWNTEMHHKRALILLEIPMQMLIKGQDWYISADAHKSGTVTSRSMHLGWLCLSACLSACLCVSLYPLYIYGWLSKCIRIGTRHMRDNLTQDKHTGDNHTRDNHTIYQKLPHTG